MTWRNALDLVKPTLELFRRLIGETDPRRVEALIKTYGLEHFLRMPVLYTDQYGLNYLLYPGQNAEVYFHHRGNYETGEIQVLKDLVEPGMTVLDIGANIGLYTLLFAKWTGTRGQVHAFEAESRNYHKLLTNIALNPFRNIRANHWAAYSESTTLNLNVFPESVNAWHSLGKPAMRDPWNPGRWMEPERLEIVTAVRLDDYCQNTGLERVGLLKIDVEGAELDVLKGCSHLLESGRIDHIMFELSKAQLEGMGYSPGQLFDFLGGYGYRSHYVQPDGMLSAKVQVMEAPYGNYIAVRDGL